MVRFTTLEDLQKDLTADLLNNSPQEERCPNLKIDDSGPYCSRDLKKQESISEQRRLICDNASLQLYCLDKTRYDICIWFNGEPFDE